MSVPRTLLVAAVVLLAGCAGVGGSEPYTDTGAALDGDTLRESHVENLRSAGSFTSSFNASYVADGSRTTINLTTRVDTEEDRALRYTRLNASGPTVSGVLETTAYTAGDTTYRKRTLQSEDGSASSYDSDSAPYDALQPVNTTTAQLVGVLGDVDRVNWTQAGVERYDGTSVTRYEADGVAAFVDASSVAVPGSDAPPQDPSVGDGEVVEAGATLLVTGDGTVRLLEVTFVVDTEQGRTAVSYRISFEGIGTTEVEEPSWTDRASEGQQADARQP